MNAKVTAHQAFLRESNLSLVLQLIHDEAPVSRARLASETGLNKSTVSSLVEELLRLNLVHETGINSTGAGRPATLLEINPEAGGIIGVELGVDFVSVVLTNFIGKVFWRERAEADPTASIEKTLDQALELIKKAVAVSRTARFLIMGLSFSIPGTVDIEEGLVIFAPNLNWHNVALCDIFSAATGLKVFIENDANAAALAEHLFGAAQKLKDFIFVFAGVGLGGGLFLNGELYRGKGGYAGEIGHTPIMAEPFQNPCHCGNLGCWETYANQDSIVSRVQSRINAKQDEKILSLMNQEGKPLSISIIKQAADMGDEAVIDSLTEAGTAMGNGLAGLVNIFNPEKIIIGGPVSVVGDYLLPFIRKSVDKHSMPEIAVQTEVGLSAFGPDASLIGAVAVVVNDILSNPSHVERR